MGVFIFGSVEHDSLVLPANIAMEDDANAVASIIGWPT
jgi:hypothetical protein